MGVWPNSRITQPNFRQFKYSFFSILESNIEGRQLLKRKSDYQIFLNSQIFKNILCFVSIYQNCHYFQIFRLGQFSLVKNKHKKTKTKTNINIVHGTQYILCTTQFTVYTLMGRTQTENELMMSAELQDWRAFWLASIYISFIHDIS